MKPTEGIALTARGRLVRIRPPSTEPSPKDLPTSSRAEREFIEAAKAGGWSVMKRGWPDFLIWRGNEWCVVEVKRTHPIVSKHQYQVMCRLHKAGIKCWVWTPSNGFVRFRPSIRQPRKRPGKVGDERGSQSPEVAPTSERRRFAGVKTVTDGQQG